MKISTPLTASVGSKTNGIFLHNLKGTLEIYAFDKNEKVLETIVQNSIIDPMAYIYGVTTIKQHTPTLKLCVFIKPYGIKHWEASTLVSMGFRVSTVGYLIEL